MKKRHSRKVKFKDQTANTSDGEFRQFHGNTRQISSLGHLPSAHCEREKAWSLNIPSMDMIALAAPSWPSPSEIPIKVARMTMKAPMKHTKPHCHRSDIYAAVVRLCAHIYGAAMHSSLSNMTSCSRLCGGSPFGHRHSV